MNGETKWATVQQLTVADNPDKYCPPSYKEFIAKLPAVHPRVYLDKNAWNDVMDRGKNSTEGKAYITRAEKVLKTPMKSVNDINVDLAANLKNKAQRNA